jgi:hypothetical protein
MCQLLDLSFKPSNRIDSNLKRLILLGHAPFRIDAFDTSTTTCAAFWQAFVASSFFLAT